MRGNHYKLPAPFFVLATQNPIELEGTYPLPEAQLDRFLFNTVLDYLSARRRDEGPRADHDDRAPRRPSRSPPPRRSWSSSSWSAWCRSPIPSRAMPSIWCACHASDDPQRARFRQEIRQLRRQRARHAVPGARREGRALMHRRYHVTYEDIAALMRSDPAPSHSAELPCRIRQADAGRHPEADSGGEARAAARSFMLQRFLDPSVLASISGLELIAKTVVDGFVAGLHRSPDFGFSQEFAEYRAYSEGDDLRHVDWNVFARTERAYLKRYRGETNTQLTMLLDASASMAYGSHKVNKLDYARYLVRVDRLSVEPAARRGRHRDFRRRGTPVRAAVQPARAVHARAARDRESRARHPHGLRKAVSALHEFPPPARHSGRGVRLLRGPGTGGQDRWSRCALTAMS